MELMHGIGSIQYFTKEFMATQRVINVYLYLVRMQSCRKKEEEKKKIYVCLLNYFSIFPRCRLLPNREAFDTTFHSLVSVP